MEKNSSSSTKSNLFQHLQQLKEQQTYDLLHSNDLRQQYDDKLLQELQQLRAQNDQEIVGLREEIAMQYEKKVNLKRIPSFDSFEVDLFRSKICKRVLVDIWNK